MAKKKAASPHPLFARATNLVAAKKEWARRLLGTGEARPLGAKIFLSAVSAAPQRNVLGVGIGEKISDGRATGIPCIKFLVRTKIPQRHLDRSTMLPRSVNGLVTDVEEVGLLIPLKKPVPKATPGAAPALPNPKTRIRPAQPGCSVGFRDPADQFVMAGTFGALVKDRNGVYVLSNSHVLANEGRLPAGSPIFQPGLLDGGNASTDQIAEVSRFVPLDTSAPNKVDAAIARALDSQLVSNATLFIGPPVAKAAAAIDMVVHKFGRTTSYTAGHITSIDTDVTIPYEIGQLTFESQIVIRGLNGSFSAAGDSGSLILERSSGNAVGLLFAGSTTHTLANHIDDVLQALSVTLA